MFGLLRGSDTQSSSLVPQTPSLWSEKSIVEQRRDHGTEIKKLKSRAQ